MRKRVRHFDWTNRNRSIEMDQLPTGFGEGGSIDASEDQIYSKYLRLGFEEKKVDTTNSSDSDGDSDSDDDFKEKFPTSHEFPLSDSNKKITILKFSTSGHNLFSASADYYFNIYNFNSLNPAHNHPQKTTEIYETHPITKLDINRKDQILTIPTDLSFKVLSSDGEVLKEFREGDRYIYDVKTTRGHTDILTDGLWNPVDQNKFITSSNDSTFRTWDLNAGKQERVNFIKHKGKKTKISKVVYTNNSKTVIAADESSRITSWDLQGNLNRPAGELQLDGHITSINTNPDDEYSLLVRTTNNDLKLYDLRNLKTPAMQRLNFPTTSLDSCTLYQGQYILASTTFENPERGSELHIMDRSDLVTLETLQFDEAITALDWNRSIDQIAVGTNSGKLSVLFNPEISKNGVKISINNKPKRRHFDESDNFATTSAAQVGYNMNELAEMNKNKKRKNGDGEQDEPKQKQKFIWGTTDADKIENNINLEDPREALMKYSKSKK